MSALIVGKKDDYSEIELAAIELVVAKVASKGSPDKAYERHSERPPSHWTIKEYNLYRVLRNGGYIWPKS